MDRYCLVVLGKSPKYSTAHDKGGSFLYVATVIQPLSSPDPHEHSHAAHASTESPHAAEELGKYSRTILLMLGMVLPVALSSLVGDDH